MRAFAQKSEQPQKRPHPGRARDPGPAHASPAPRATIQAKLTVNTPGDVYEREADETSERVMRLHRRLLSGHQRTGRALSQGRRQPRGLHAALEHP